MTTVETSEIAVLTSCIWDAWTKRAAIKSRGFDSERLRAKLYAEVDDYLEDLHLELLLRDGAS